MVEIRIAKDTSRLSLSSKITYVLFGIAASSLLLSISIKFLKVTGIYLGALACAVLIFLGFTYTKASSRTRLITWGALSTLTILIVLYLSFLLTVSKISI